MRRLFPFALAGTALVLLAAVALPTVPVGHVSDLFKETRTGRYQVLVFSKTTGFRHNSIPSGIAMIERLAQNNDFDVVASEDATLFNDDDLAEFEAVIFLSTTGNILNDEQQDAFERYIQGGGGFAGIHAATDTEYDWPWYGELVGTYFESHPPGTPTATIKVADQVHPSTAHLPKEWERTDEWYNFRENPRGKVHVLMTLDEDTYSGGTDGHDHPIAWCRPFNGGRSWYTGGGHTSASFSEPDFERHVLGGIEYAAGFNDGDCSATLSESYEVKVLEDDLGNPMMMDIASDGRIFIAERRGQVRIHTPSTGITETVGTVDVYSEQENGLLGLALDPNFDDTQWIYLFYSPPGSRAVQNVSRFTMNGDMLDLGSEELILEIENQREECCHSGGALYFHDATGELYIATGDDTNPFTSSGFGPMDERPGRAAWDAQRTSGNTQDLRGKIMRIKPEPEGGYSIPEGNLFTDPAEGRPEIYAMGSRNPFRISVDQERGWLYWGEVGPDAQQNSSTRGPRGYDEWNQARSAGNYGWPYCLADNKSYRDFDFGEERSGSTFDCANLVNDSPNNTGAAQLPPARPAMVWYPYAQSDEFPVLGT
ncbi:MAG: ThuA domain-containing protein, partial [Bacteroidota bacterium]